MKIRKPLLMVGNEYCDTVTTFRPLVGCPSNFTRHACPEVNLICMRFSTTASREPFELFIAWFAPWKSKLNEPTKIVPRLAISNVLSYNVVWITGDNPGLGLRLTRRFNELETTAA